MEHNRHLAFFRDRRASCRNSSSLKSAVSRLRSAEVAGARKSSISKDANQALISYREAMKYPNELGLYEFVENFISESSESCGSYTYLELR